MDRLTRALDLLNAGDAAGALVIARALSAENADNPNVLLVLGEAQRRTGAVGEGVDTLRRALALAPHDAALAYRVGQACVELGKHSHAVEAFDACLGHRDASFSRAVSLVALGRQDEAIVAFQQVVSADPTHATAFGNLGILLNQAGRVTEAIAALASAVTCATTPPKLLETVVALLLQEGRSGEADTLCGQVVERWPGVAEILDLHGLVLRECGHFDNAVERHNQALELVPGHHKFLCNLGYALRRTGETDLAEARFREVIGLVADYEDAHVGLASLQFDQRRLEEAQATLTAYDRLISAPTLPKRSIVIPVLDYSPGSRFNISTLLDNLKDVDGEVICIFNSDNTYYDLRNHPRIDKFSYNKHNVGVSRAWNMGINQAEGATIFILNADLYVTAEALDTLEAALQTLPDALGVGVSGDWLDPATGQIRDSLGEGATKAVTEVDIISGHIFALHAERLHEAGIFFDPRLAPYLYEEVDLGLKARQAGLKLYVVPTTGYCHTWGISRRDRRIYFFGRLVNRLRCMIANSLLLKRKWQRINNIKELK
jgi:Flp pilus assembly protein TadD